MFSSMLVEPGQLLGKELRVVALVCVTPHNVFGSSLLEIPCPDMAASSVLDIIPTPNIQYKVEAVLVAKHTNKLVIPLEPRIPQAHTRHTLDPGDPGALPRHLLENRAELPPVTPLVAQYHGKDLDVRLGKQHGQDLSILPTLGRYPAPARGAQD
jgi:hypothetical protein